MEKIATEEFARSKSVVYGSKWLQQNTTPNKCVTYEKAINMGCFVKQEKYKSNQLVAENDFENFLPLVQMSQNIHGVQYLDDKVKITGQDTRMLMFCNLGNMTTKDFYYTTNGEANCGQIEDAIYAVEGMYFAVPCELDGVTLTSNTKISKLEIECQYTPYLVLNFGESVIFDTNVNIIINSQNGYTWSDTYLSNLWLNILDDISVLMGNRTVNIMINDPSFDELNKQYIRAYFTTSSHPQVKSFVVNGEDLTLH